MVSITIKYEEHNPIAKSAIRFLRTLGVFKISKPQVIVDDNLLSEDLEKEGFLYTSRINAAKNFEKFL